MTEVLFYHLTESKLETALPGLVERSLARGWRVVVQCGSGERLAALDNVLWTWRDESFIPHSALRDGSEAHQPVWLTTGEDNPNGAAIRFLVDGATASGLSGYERAVYLFDGHVEEELARARERWKVEKEAGHAVTYWQQNATGGWEKKA